VPELPEVETVRRGLSDHLVGRTLVTVRVHHPRVHRNHVGGADDLRARLTGVGVLAVERRGKYLWLPLQRRRGARDRDAGADADAGAMLAHLGMSGQFRVTDAPLLDHPHRRFDAELDDGRWLTFLDQRTFGGVGWDVLVPDSSGTRDVPAGWQHVAPDPFEPGFDQRVVTRAVRRSSSEVKRLLLDQTLVSGIGNIYADESLWRARTHPARMGRSLSTAAVGSIVAAAREVMDEALARGGTSFDSLYVDVNGDSGYFERSLAVYGREDEPCQRCGAPVRRLQFTNRSSFVCLRCQRPPRASRSRR
jgi:formamidopyrimidine-DNA glycosylase